jgi:hypothetical protein
MTKINLFDFDETIYDGDSTVDFFKFIFKKKPITIFWLFVMLLFVILYVLRIINKTTMKETFYKIFTFIDVNDDLLKEFWDSHEKNIKKFYIDRKHEDDIVISASPEFLLKPICNRLGVKDMMASKVDPKTGKYDGINCHDVEKVRRLNEKYSNYYVMESFSDSIKSDRPILELAEKAYQVKGDRLILLDLKK